MTILRRDRATTPYELEAIDRTDDASFAPEGITFDSERRVLTIPFEQEPWPDDGSAATAELVEERGRDRIEKVPFLRCALEIGLVRSWSVKNEEMLGGLLGVSWKEDTREVIAHAGPGSVRAVVDAIDVTIIVTDEVDYYIRRRHHRGRIFSSITDTPWPSSS